MGALRKAGVWLGLIEDDDEGYAGGYDHHGYDDYEDEDEVVPVRQRASERASVSERAEAAAESPRVHSRASESHSRVAESSRLDALRAESSRVDSARTESPRADAGRGESLRAEPVRPTVRPIPRTNSSLSTDGSAYPTRDNLALAPQLHLRERPAAVEQDDRRYQITTLHPTTYNEARTIGEHFRDGVPVIMNLTEMAEADAKRLVDFAAGLAFGLRGSMERVTNRVFLLSPANVQVTPEDKMKIAEGGFFAT